MIPDENDFTAIHFAIYYHKNELLKSLLKKYDIPKITSSGLSIMALAIKFDNLEAVDILSNNYYIHLSSGKDEDPLELAVRYKKLDIIKLFLRKGLKVKDGRDAVYSAANSGNLDILNLILANKKTLPTGGGETSPLFLPAAKGYLEIVWNLLNFGYPVVLDNGRSALHYAILRNQPKIVVVLLKYVNPLDMDESGKTALHQAVDSGNKKL